MYIYFPPIFILGVYILLPLKILAILYLTVFSHYLQSKKKNLKKNVIKCLNQLESSLLP